MTAVLIIIAVGTTTIAVVFALLHLRGLISHNNAVAEWRIKLVATEAAQGARVEELEKARSDLDTRFKGIAAEVVESNQKAFLEQAQVQSNKDSTLRQEKINVLLKPIEETLKRFESHVGEVEKDRVGAYNKLHTQVSQLHDDTVGLREVLRSSPARGKWGEQTLHNIIDIAGLRNHIDFVEQSAIPTASGSIRPDAVVHIPGGLEVVIDAKAPFNAYYEAHETEDEAEQVQHLKRHAQAVLDRAKELRSRDYSNLVQGSPDFVVMFVPTDPILDAAVDADPDLWETAWTSHRVLIATPGLLVAFLRTVAAAWQQRDLQENAQKISDEAVKLYKALRTYASHVNKVGKGLESAVRAHNDAIASLEGRVLPPARKLENLGPGAELDKVGEVQAIETAVNRITKPELTQPELPPAND